MKFIQTQRSSGAGEALVGQVGRRGLVVGAGVAGAAAVAAAALHRGAIEPEPVVARAEGGAREKDGGYALTPHVQRYYETAKG